MIAVLCGGVGAARMLAALAQVHDPADTVAIVNTADDTVLHGLSISPDLDTVVYTLAAAIDPERGWGLEGESWRAMENLARYQATRPADSDAAGTWFNLGDRDLATHLYRSARLREGATLTAVTAEIAAAWGLDQTVLPMSDDPVRTIVTLADGTDVSFQEYFVRLHHDVPVRAVRFDGAARARLSAAAAAALQAADAVIIAPSNPVVSIGPLRAIAGVDAALTARRDQVVAVSPIVGGAALKGPADRMLRELGSEASCTAVATLYAPIAGTLVIDPADAGEAAAIRATGMRCVVTPTVMSVPGVARSLGQAVLAAAGLRV